MKSVGTKILLIVFTFCVTHVPGQVDSLKKLLTHKISDVEKASVYVSLAEAIEDEKTWIAYNDSAMAIALKQSRFATGADEKRYKKILSSCYNNKGFSAENHGKIEEALAFYQKALALTEEINETKGQAEILN